MRGKKRTRYIHEGRYAAAVEVTLIEHGNEWASASYLSLEDAYRLDDVREALRSGDIQSAARFSPWSPQLIGFAVMLPGSRSLPNDIDDPVSALNGINGVTAHKVEV